MPPGPLRRGLWTRLILAQCLWPAAWSRGSGFGSYWTQLFPTPCSVLLH